MEKKFNDQTNNIVAELAVFDKFVTGEYSTMEQAMNKARAYYNQYGIIATRQRVNELRETIEQVRH